MPLKTVHVELNQGSGYRTECRARQHTVIIDQAPEAGGTDTGPTPLDYQLFAFGGCIAVITRLVANQRRLAIRGVRVAVEGVLDTDRLLGKTVEKRAGFTTIKATVDLDADLSPADKEKLLHEIDGRCPISDNLKQPAAIEITLAS